MKYAASFIGWSNSGKTTLIETLIYHFTLRGYAVSGLKQSHQTPLFDTEGKDTDRYFRSGARDVAYISEKEGFLRFRCPCRNEQISSFFSCTDILLCEGYRYPGAPCLEVLGPSFISSGLKGDPSLVNAYIFTCSDASGWSPPEGQPVLHAGDPNSIIDYLEETWTGKSPSK